MGVEIMTVEQRAAEYIGTLKGMIKEFSGSKNGVSTTSQGVLLGLNIALTSAKTWFKSELEPNTETEVENEA